MKKDEAGYPAIKKLGGGQCGITTGILTISTITPIVAKTIGAGNRSTDVAFCVGIRR